MGIIKTAVKRRVTVLMLFLCIVVLGLVSLAGLGVDLMPDMEIPVAVIMTTYNGAGSQEVESMVTEPVEQVVASVQGIEEIYSSSSSGMSMVMVQYDWGVDLDFATLDLREKIDMVEAFLPDGVDAPLVMKMNMNSMPIMVMAVSGDMGLAELKQVVENDLVPMLERQSGVASVQIGGGYTEQIDVTVNPQTLENYGISMTSIMGAIAANNVNLAAGEIVDGGKNQTIRVMGKYDSLSDIENVDVTLASGAVMKLKDIASIAMVNVKEDFDAYQNGEECVYIAITKQSDANTVDTSKAVLEAVREGQEKLPGNLDINAIMNQGEMIQMTIDNMIDSLLTGAVLAVAILFVFLRSMRSTLVIAISIPVSLIATCMLLYFNDMTFNMMTLGGMALGAGMMVDSSIVVLENIQRLRTEGMNGHDAAVKGASQMVLSIISSTLTTIAVFLPLVFAGGLVSILFNDLAMTISFALMASLVTAIILVPMLCSEMLRPEESYSTEGGGLKAFIGKGQNAFADGFEKLRHVYDKALKYCLHHRKLTVGFVAVLLVVSFGLLAFVGMEFVPTTASGQLIVDIVLEDGTAKEQTALVAERAETIILNTVGDDIKSMLTLVGGDAGSMAGGGENNAQFMMTLVDSDERNWDIEELTESLRSQFADIAGAEFSISSGDMMSMSSTSSGGGGASVSISGENLDVLNEIAEKIVAIMETMPGAREIETSMDDALPELNLQVNYNKAAQLGMTVPQINSTISSYINGLTATKYTLENGTEIDVKVQVPKEYQENIDLILNQKMTSPSGQVYRLGDVVSLVQGYGPIDIAHQGQERYMTVSCTVIGVTTGEFAADLQERLDAEIVLPEGYTIEQGGDYQEMIDAFRQLALALLLGMLLVYMIMASLFESFSQPFIIFFTIPTALIGAFWGLFLTGSSLNVVSVIGVIMLVGIVVNNGIILVDTVNILRREEGKSAQTAIMMAGSMRLRPVLMTALTTILSMLPMAFFAKDGAEMTSSLAVVVACGLATSTFFTLLLVPVVYSLFEDLAQKMGRRKETSRQGLHAVAEAEE